jgi:hypothetical protein
MEVRMRTIRFPLEAWELLQHAMATAEVRTARQYLERAKKKQNDRVILECPESAIDELRDFFQRRADETRTLIDNAVRQGRHDADLAQGFAAAVHGLKALDEAMGVASRE